jgi:hypothetical protein
MTQKPLLASLLILWLLACQPPKETIETVRNTSSVLFIDKSNSLNYDQQFVKTKYEKALDLLIQQNINTKGDILDVYFIHENTPKGKVMSLQCRIEKPETAGMNPTDIEAKNMGYQLDIKKERALMFNAIKNQIATKNTSVSNKYTDVWGSLIPLASGAYQNAYYFSDMKHSMPRGRDFEKASPKSATEAEQWAAEDQKVLGKQLDGTTIAIYLPYPPTAASTVNNPHIGSYWQKALSELGALSVSEN